MDKSTLANMMLEWEKLNAKITEIENAIKDSVLQLGETQVAGNVRATYSGGRKTYNYKEVGSDADTVLVDKYTETKTVTSTDWKKLVTEGMGISQDIIPFTQTAPSVTIKQEK